MNRKPDLSSLQQIGTLAAISVVVGSIIGTGIFLAPTVVASFTTSISLVVLLWVLGGILCFVGADIYGKLGIIFPNGAGQYVYLRECLGENFSMLYGWLSFLVISPTMIASIALFFGIQLKLLFPGISSLYTKESALVMVAAFTFINCMGIKTAGSVQRIVVSLQILIITLFSISVIIYCHGNTPILQFNEQTYSLRTGVLAFVAILWSFEGFNSLTFITDEVRDGYRRIRWLTFAGCAVVFLIYLLLKITNYKIHDIKIYGLKSLLIKNNVDKLGRIDKYYNQHDIEHWQ